MTLFFTWQHLGKYDLDFTMVLYSISKFYSNEEKERERERKGGGRGIFVIVFNEAAKRGHSSDFNI